MTDYYKSLRQLKAAQANYDNMEPPDGPDEDDVDPKFKGWQCYLCGEKYTMEEYDNPPNECECWDEDSSSKDCIFEEYCDWDEWDEWLNEMKAEAEIERKLDQMDYDY